MRVLSTSKKAAALPATAPAVMERTLAGRRLGSVARITLIGKAGCHLCDDARQVVARVAAQAGADVEELSIDDDPDLAERYWEQIPVVLVDGAQHAFHRVDEHRLGEALAGRRSWLRRR